MANIFLQPEVKSGLGEDTFWTWFARETGAIFELPKKLSNNDIVLHYSTLGEPQFPEQTVTLLWELYPEMKLRLGEPYRKRMKLISQSQNARWLTVPSNYSRAFYSRDTQILPIGVDTKLFCPSHEKRAGRERLGLDPIRKIAVWAGSNHPMKGPDLRDEWIAANRDWQVITVKKEHPMPQTELAELLSVMDGVLNTSRLVPLYMFDWECFAANLPLIPAGGVRREHEPLSPRTFVTEIGWDRESTLSQWLEFIDRCRHEMTRDTIA